ncbi:hypothetical protein HanRHA438_Chr15g0698351 [Helianthus annuus]|nr:hypothetical protein HanRHA438_Chr15g0698351 [Helianthus annuus]
MKRMRMKTTRVLCYEDDANGGCGLKKKKGNSWYWCWWLVFVTVVVCGVGRGGWYWKAELCLTEGSAHI